MTRREFAALIASTGVFLVGSSANAQSNRPVQKQVKATLAIVGGSLIDGQSAQPVSDSVVLVDGKQIVAVGTRATLKVPSGAKVINASGRTVMPGLFNTHVHLDFLGHADYVVWHRAHTPYDPKSDEISVAAAKQLLMGGVTTAVDLGGLPATVVKIRDSIKRGEIVGPRLLVSCGWIWTASPEVEAANHRGMFSKDHPDYLFNVHTPEQARAAVLRTIELGADIIKVSAGEAGDAKLGLGAEELKVIAEEAHKRHLLVTGHSHGDEDTISRIEHGQDGIEHTSFNVDNPNVIRAFVAHNTVVDPTTMTGQAGRDALESPEWRNDPRARALTPPGLWEEVRSSIADPASVPYWRGAFREGASERSAHMMKGNRLRNPCLIDRTIVPTMAHGQQGREATHCGRFHSERDDSGRVLSEAQHCGHHVRLLAAHSKEQAQIGGDRRGNTAQGRIRIGAGQWAAHRKFVGIRRSRPAAADSGRRGVIRCSGWGWRPRSTQRWNPWTCARASTDCTEPCAISLGKTR